QGTTLQARCQGSQPEPYRVRVTLEAGEVSDAHCSCPVGGGGACKHVAAVLLAWVHTPAVFRDAEPIEEALQRRSKEELIALIRQMLRRQPDLEMLLEAPLPGAGRPASPVGPEPYRQQA